MTFRVVRTNQYNQDLGLINSTNGNHLESPKEGSSIDHQVTIYLHAQNITMFPTNETWYFASQILVSNSGGLILILTLLGLAEALRNEVGKTVQNVKDQAAGTTYAEFPPSSAAEQEKNYLKKILLNDPEVGQRCAEIQPKDILAHNVCTARKDYKHPELPYLRSGYLPPHCTQKALEDMKVVYSLAGAPFKPSSMKKEMKVEYRLLNDIVAKSLTAKAGRTAEMKKKRLERKKKEVAGGEVAKTKKQAAEGSKVSQPIQVRSEVSSETAEQPLEMEDTSQTPGRGGKSTKQQLRILPSD
ncbi:hypothetical protein F511_31684 [Dorcoceras hygrometricum]|uniref:Uncharacterized protein n=1 Tax=Dorcoceras hygrometricum TaxID=472368 RepID=A0A2Z7CT25_9LAMI|nr:hypothetical protein F511_31684 [Dorcoceras hygrometricum]